MMAMLSVRDFSDFIAEIDDRGEVILRTRTWRERLILTLVMTMVVNLMLLPAFYFGIYAIIGAEMVVLIFIVWALGYQANQQRAAIVADVLSVNERTIIGIDWFWQAEYRDMKTGLYRLCWGIADSEGRVIPLFVCGAKPIRRYKGWETFARLSGHDFRNIPWEGNIFIGPGM